MKERLLPKNTLAIVGLAASVSLGSFFIERHQEPYTSEHFINKNTALLLQNGSFDIIKRDGFQLHIPGEFTSYYDHAEFSAIGSKEDDVCRADIVLPDKTVITIKDIGVNAYRISQVSDKTVTYFNDLGYAIEQKLFDREFGIATTEEIFPYYQYPPYSVKRC